MKTIMLCLNKLDIGGIETAVLNQTINLIKKEYRVIILAADGIYRKKFENEGAIFVEMGYSIKDTNICKKVEKVEKIIDEYQVEQVHIHQFDCINILFFVCMFKNIPYVAYLHNNVKDILGWFEQVNYSYKELLKLYFEYAYKIVAIQEKAKIMNQKKFNFPDDKYLIIKNAINFDKFRVENNYIPEKIEKVLVISRFAFEKEKSILNAIDLFKDYYRINKEARLTIVGDGEIKEKIENEITDIKDVTTMLGARNDIAEIVSQNDIVISLDRCILEAIAMKKIAIVSGYEEMKEIITDKNIEKASDNNFNGDNLETKQNDELIKILKNLNSNRIKEIVEKNYNYAYENLNSNKNFYIIEEPEKRNLNEDTIEILKDFMNIIEDASKNILYTEKIYNDCQDTKKWFEGQLEIKDIEIQNLSDEIKKIKTDNININKELTNIYNSKSYKLCKKIGGILKK